MSLRPNTLVTDITRKKRYQLRQIGTCQYDQYRWWTQVVWANSDGVAVEFPILRSKNLNHTYSSRDTAPKVTGFLHDTGERWLYKLPSQVVELVRNFKILQLLKQDKGKMIHQWASYWESNIIRWFMLTKCQKSHDQSLGLVCSHAVSRAMGPFASLSGGLLSRVC